MTIKSCAEAFIAGRPARCHNAETDGTEYRLHGSRIAWRESDGTILASFCGWPHPNHQKPPGRHYNCRRCPAR